MKALGFRYFPDVDLSRNKNPTINWTGDRVIRLEYPDEDDPEGKRHFLLEDLTSNVKAMLVKRKIVFQGVINAKLDHVHIFPWLAEVSLFLSPLITDSCKVGGITDTTY